MSSSCYTMHPTLHTVRGDLQQAHPPCLASPSSIKHQAKSIRKNAMMQRNSSKKKKASANPVVTGPNSPAPLLSTQYTHGPRTIHPCLPPYTWPLTQNIIRPEKAHASLSLACYARCRPQPVPKRNHCRRTALPFMNRTSYAIASSIT